MQLSFGKKLSSLNPLWQREDTQVSNSFHALFFCAFRNGHRIWHACAYVHQDLKRAGFLLQPCANCNSQEESHVCVDLHAEVQRAMQDRSKNWFLCECLNGKIIAATCSPSFFLKTGQMRTTSRINWCCEKECRKEIIFHIFSTHRKINSEIAKWKL